ncbi:helix-turn-helix domain-containing protein [Macrococcus equi]|uniref:helix-turn-helix domain-containing protein n=1 Tax=Macrococcus equi TaxID=3395462 RepID=UPI0039BDD9C7
MKNIDLKLLEFNHYLKTEDFNRKRAAEVLGISERQLIRNINKWQDDGFLEYRNGRGRGNRSYLKLRLDIEQYYVNEIINNIDCLKIEDMDKINELPISVQSKSIIHTLLNQCIHQPKHNSGHYKILDYIYRIPELIKPTEDMDVALSTIIFNTMDRLYEFDADGHLRSNIVAYDEWQEDGLLIHLYQDIHFSNGHLVFAENVVDCLKCLVEDMSIVSMIDIQTIEVVSDFVLKIKMNRSENIKFLLSQPHLSIYKDVDGKSIGTGPYVVAEHTNDKVVLKHSSQSHRFTPDVNEVILINDMEKYQQYFDTNKLSQFAIFHKINFIIFNPDTRLSLDDRKMILNAAHDFLINRNVEKEFQRVIKIEPYPCVERDTAVEIKMLVIESFKREQYFLYEYLVSLGFKVHKTEVTFETFLSRDIDEWDVDFIWLNEASPEVLFFYNLLSTSKFTKWLLNCDKSEEILKRFESTSVEDWSVINQEYQSYFKENARLSILSYGYRRYFVEKEYRNIIVNPYGVMLYDSLVHEEGN